MPVSGSRCQKELQKNRSSKIHLIAANYNVFLPGLPLGISKSNSLMLLDKPIPPGYIFKKIKGDFLTVVVLALLVHGLSTWYQHLLPVMPLTIPGFIGTAISVLLSFKLSQSYERWWEARKIWGSIVNDSRSLVVQLKSLLVHPHHPKVRQMGYRQIAWCYSLAQSLRGLPPLEELEDLLTADEYRRLLDYKNKPLALLDMQAADLHALREERQLEVLTHLQIDSTLVRLCESQGRAERIKSTVFPVTYRYFLHLMIYLFVITLSLSLKDVPFRFELPLLLAISLSFFLLEKSAKYMQDPFENQPTDTAMTAISRTIETNVRQLLGETVIPEPIQPSGFFLS